MVRSCVLAILAVVASACVGADQIKTTQPTAVDRFALQPGQYVHIAWPTGDTIVMGWQAPDGSRMVMATPESAPQDLDVSLPGNCQDRRPQSLPAERISFVRECYSDAGDRSEVIVADPKSGDLRIVQTFPDIWKDGGRMVLYSVALNPDGVTGIAGVGSVICDSIGWFDTDALTEFAFALPAGSEPGNPFVAPCPETMNVREPNLTADGRTLAVLVAPETLNRDGWDRLDAPYDVVLIDTATRDSRFLFGRIPGAYRMTLSPDGKTLAVLCEARTPGETFTLFVPMDGGEPTRLDARLDGPITEIAWSPDSQSLVVLVRMSDFEALETLTVPVVIDLPSVGAAGE